MNSSSVRSDLNEIQKSHLLKTLSDYLFRSVLLPQFWHQQTLESLESAAIQIKADPAQKAFIRQCKPGEIAKVTVWLHVQLLQALPQCVDFDPDHSMQLAIHLYRQSQKLAQSLFQESPELADDCCQWSHQGKQIIPLLPPQTQIVELASKNLLISTDQQFHLAAALGLSNQISELSPIDLEFVLTLKSTLIYRKDLEIIFVPVGERNEPLKLPYPKCPRRVYIGLKWDKEHQWLMLYGYGYGYSFEQTTVTRQELHPIPNLQEALNTADQAVLPLPVKVFDALDDLEDFDPLDEFPDDSSPKPDN